MRLKKASINVFVNLLTYILGILPSFIVRRVFLEALGNEMLGLSSLYGNIIGLLSMVELGVGSAIIYALYKPFAEGDKEKVKGYLDFFAKFYRIVGTIIFVLGLLMIPFLHLFIGNEVALLDAQFYFVLFLINTVISYFFSYKLCILNVAQEQYKISIVTTFCRLLVSILQFTLLRIYPSFYGYILIQIVIDSMYFLFMNLYIDKKYKWLKSTVGRITKEERKSLTKNVKAIFMHKIGSTFVFGVDNIVISSFINLTVVGIFNSYNMVISGINGIISSAFSGITASVGNLLVDGSSEDIYKVHKRLFFISFWIVSFATISLFNTLKQFVLLWLGEGQILDQLTINIILINFYFVLMRASVERFKEGGGVYYQDRFAPLVEGVINLATSIILVNIIGLPGVFLGTLISNVSVVFWIKPKMVYKYIFHRKLSEYFKMYFKYLLIGLVPLFITYLATMPLKEVNGILAFVANCIINIVLINLIYFIIFRKNEEFMYFRNLALNMIRKRKTA